MSIADSFIKVYADKTYKYTTTVRHKGTVIAFAMDESRRIYYGILDLDQSSDSKNASLDVMAVANLLRTLGSKGAWGRTSS